MFSKLTDPVNTLNGLMDLTSDVGDLGPMEVSTAVSLLENVTSSVAGNASVSMKIGTHTHTHTHT